jgi:hypothetical protein
MLGDRAQIRLPTNAPRRGPGPRQLVTSEGAESPDAAEPMETSQERWRGAGLIKPHQEEAVIPPLWEPARTPPVPA